MTSKTIEKLARALCEADGFNADCRVRTIVNHPLPHKYVMSWEDYIEQAEVAIKYLKMLVLPAGSKAEEGDYVMLPDALGFDVIDEIKEVFSNGNFKTVSYERPWSKGKRIIHRTGYSGVIFEGEE